MDREVSSPDARVGSLLAAAARRCDRHECEEAIGLLEEAVRIQPANARLYYQLGFCQSGGCRQHPLVDPDMAEQYLRHALALVGSSSQSVLRGRILDALANTLVKRHAGAQRIRLRDAIEYHREAAAIYQSSGLSDDWAREEFNQANAWCDLPEPEFPDKWAEAVRHFENALRMRTKDKDPKGYATTVMNLGTALRQLSQGDRAANVLKAIQCFHAALRVYTFAASPAHFANLSNNLGNACLTYPAGDVASRTRHARYALQHFERALAIWTCGSHPYYYSLAQYNRGCAYLQLSPSPASVEKALVCLTEARECALSCGHDEIARLARAQAYKVAFPFV